MRRLVAGTVLGVTLAVSGPGPALSEPDQPAAPAPAAAAGGPTNRELLEEIAALKKRLEDLERKLQERSAPSPPAPLKLQRDSPAADEKPAGPPDTAKSLIARAGSRFEVGGFAQIRITNMGTAAGDRSPGQVDFQVTRFRPRLIWIQDQHWEADLDINATSRSTPGAASLSARDAYVQWQNHGYQARVGQAKIPFGYEVYLEGDTDRVEMERARILNILYPDERDLGLFARTVPRTATAAWIAAGVYNGNGINRMDNNTAKDVAATVKVPLNKHHVVGTSVSTGNFLTAGGETFVRQAAGFEHRFTSGRFASKMEVLAGRNLGADIWGGYAGARYYTGVFGGIFARYDVFDPNRDVENDMFRRLAVGWYKELSSRVRITAEYDYVTNKLSQPNDTYAVQVQARL